LTCPNAPGRYVVELYTGEVSPAGCRKLNCLYCLPRLARRRTMAITAVRPARMIRLSLVADRRDEDVCTTALTRINRTRSELARRKIQPGEWTWTIERNPQGTGFHAHCLQTGGYIAQSILQSACESAGAGIPYINAISRPGLWSSQYGLKGFGADGYGLKTFRSTGSALQSLALNNGRLEHHSRKFFTIDGHLYGVRAAERAALALKNREEPRRYICTSEDEAMRLSQDLEARHRVLVNRFSPTQGSGKQRIGELRSGRRVTAPKTAYGGHGDHHTQPPLFEEAR